MDGKTGSVKLHKQGVLERNKKIDVRIVNAQAELERQLKVHGVEVKPEFNIEPPLGSGKTRLFSRNF